MFNQNLPIKRKAEVLGVWRDRADAPLR